MGFQFAETMQGTVEWDAQPGVKHPFSFDITAEAESTRSHLRDGKATLRGVVHAPPLTRAAEAEGVITIRPIGRRIHRHGHRRPRRQFDPYRTSTRNRSHRGRGFT